MAKKKGSGPYTEEEYQESVDPAFKALLLQQVAIRGNGENPHEILNDFSPTLLRGKATSCMMIKIRMDSHGGPWEPEIFCAMYG